MTILGLIFPAIVIVNVLFFLLWLVLLKRYLFYSLLAIILSYSLILDHIQITGNGQVAPSDSTISILSFNARNLSNTNLNRGDKMIRAQILEFVATENADIYCFQEFQTYPTKGVNSVKDYQNRFASKYVYTTPYLQKNTHEFVDLLTVFSKYPIKNSYDFYLDGKAYGFFVDIEINGKLYRLFNLHLESNHFGRNEYEIFTEKEAVLNERKRNQLIWLLQKLKKYSVKRSYQARTIRNEIEKSPYPVIVSGDFNDTPASYSYQHISSGLKDAFHEQGKGYSNTYNGKLPPMRIDFLLFDRKIDIVKYEVLKPDFSDHFPLIVSLELNE
ncbi:MAG: hypothetical protein GQ527_01880 [Bacteroidales bacterium]|nr:hypothetical protein [Bacteroidales bacterium]